MKTISDKEALDEIEIYENNYKQQVDMVATIDFLETIIENQVFQIENLSTKLSIMIERYAKTT